MSDIYVVQSTWTGAICGASTRLQGAELIKANYQRTNPAGQFRITNVELQDEDE